jgi:DNA-binding response OmpR family regulator
MNVLLIEDNPDDAALMREHIRRASRDYPEAAVELIHVDRLAAAMPHLAEQNVDVVLLDLGLGETDGILTLERLQALSRGTPTVVLTGLDDDALAVRSVQLGAQDYLVKNRINGQVLLRVLRYAVERARLQKQLEESRMRERDERERREELREYFLATNVERTPAVGFDAAGSMVELGREYEDLIMAHLHGDAENNDRQRLAQAIAMKLAGSRARAADIVKMHVRIVEEFVSDASPIASRIMTNFARVALIEVFSLLLDVYIDASVHAAPSQAPNTV